MVMGFENDTTLILWNYHDNFVDMRLLSLLQLQFLLFVNDNILLLLVIC